MFIERFDVAVDSQESLSAIEKFSYLTGHLEGPGTSAHMNVLLKLPKLNNNSVGKLTSFYNAIESNIRSLMTMGLNPSHYGPLLIPVILERLPDSIKLIVTRKLVKNNWHISDFINCIKEEVDAVENCGFIKDKNDYEHLRNTTHLLLGVQNHSRKNCILWKITLQ